MAYTEEERTGENKGNVSLKLVEFAAALVGAVALLRAGHGEKPARQGIQDEVASERHFRRQVLQGWLIVCAVAVAFVLYGLFALFVIGDKGPPDWDFGSVEDVPGQSVYSSHPYRGREAEPEPQHVDAKPPAASAGTAAGQGPPIPKKGQGTNTATSRKRS